MITKNTYYKGELYIPQAKPSIADEAIIEGNDFSLMVDKYEEECLIKCLGPVLYNEFISELDTNQSNLLKTTADEKWDRLLNGHTYSRSGETIQRVWNGIRYKIPKLNDEYNASFLANYVYFFYERKQYITTTSVGTGKPEAKNMEMVPPTQKVVNAWNEFVKKVQGENVSPRIVANSMGLLGVDYYAGNNEVPLYTFIRDMNDIEDDYYPNFQPTTFEKMNTFGI